MSYILRLLIKEKTWLFISLICIFITAIFIMLQIGLFAQFGEVLMASEMRETETAIEDAARQIIFSEMSVREQISALVQAYQTAGREGAVELLLAQESYYFILFFGGIAVLILLLLYFFHYLKYFSTEYLTLRVITRIRRRLFEHLLYLPSGFFKNRQSGDIISRTLNDVNLIQVSMVVVFESIILSPLVIAACLYLMLRINAMFTGIMAACGVLVLVVITLISRVLKKAVRKVQESLSDLTSHLQRVLYGIDIVKIFTREKHESARFRDVLKSYLSFGRRERALLRLDRPVTETLGALALLIILMYGASQIWADNMEKNDMISFIIILVVLSPYVQKLSHVYLTVQHINVAVNRLGSVYDEAHERTAGSDLPGDFKGKVEIRNVSFRYPGMERNVLEKISISAEAGQMIALIGSSGCGKSTVLSLLPRLIEPVFGQVLFDSHDISGFSSAAIRQQVAMVSQETILFPETIMENIRYGRLDASEEEVHEVARLADIHDFIMSLPETYDTVIGERGTKLSGGQRQRLCIARAVLKKPRLLLLDEATSALDSESERAVQKAIDNLLGRQTTFVVAHRLSTIVHAHRIIVMDEGQIVEEGRHEELLARDGIYSRLWTLQHHEGS